MLGFAADYVKALKAGKGTLERGLPAPPIGGRAASKRILGDKFIRKDQYGVDNFEDYFSESSASICPPAGDSDDSEVRAKKRRKKIAVPEYSAWSSRHDSSSVSRATSQETASQPSAAAASTIKSEAELSTAAADVKTAVDRALTRASPARRVDRSDTQAMAADGARSKAALPPEPAAAALPTSDEPWARLEMPPEIALGLLPRPHVMLQQLQNLPHLQRSAAMAMTPRRTQSGGRLQAAAAAAAATSASVGQSQPPQLRKSSDGDDEAGGRVFSNGSVDLTPSPELTPIPALGTTLRVRRSTAVAGDFDLGTAGPCYSSVRIVGSPRSLLPQQQRQRHRRHVAESTRMSTAGFVELAGRASPRSGPIVAVRDVVAAAVDAGHHQNTRSDSKLPAHQQLPMQGSSNRSSISSEAAALPGKSDGEDSSCAATGSMTAAATNSRSASTSSAVAVAVAAATNSRSARALSAATVAATPCAPRRSGPLLDVRARGLYPALEAAYNSNRQSAAHEVAGSAVGGSGAGLQLVPESDSSLEGPSVSEPDDRFTPDRASREPAQLEDGSGNGDAATGSHHQRTPGSRMVDRARAMTARSAGDRPVMSDVLSASAGRQRSRTTPGSQHRRRLQESVGRDEGGTTQADAEYRTGYDGRRSTQKKVRPLTPDSEAADDDDTGPAKLTAAPERQSPQRHRGSSMSPDHNGSLSAKGKSSSLPRKPPADGASGRKRLADRLSSAEPPAVAARAASPAARSAKKAAMGEARTAIDAQGTSAKAPRNALPQAGAASLSSASRTTFGHSHRSIKESMSNRSAALALTSSRVSAASILESQRAHMHGRRVSKRLYTPADAHLEAVDDREDGEFDADDAGLASGSAPAHSYRSSVAAHGAGDSDDNDGELGAPQWSSQDRATTAQKRGRGRPPKVKAVPTSGTEAGLGGKLGTPLRSAASGGTASQRQAVATSSQGCTTTAKRGRGRPPKVKAVRTSGTEAGTEASPVSTARDWLSASQPRMHKKRAGLHRELALSPAETQSPSACVAEASLPSCSALPVHYHEMTRSSPAPLRAGYGKRRRVRVVVPDENPSDGVRRSKRVRVQTLRWDLFERIEYAPGHGGFLGVVLRDDIEQAPPRQKTTKKKAGRGKHSPARTRAAPQGDSQDFTVSVAEADDSIRDGCISIVNPRTDRKERLNCLFSQKQMDYEQPTEPDGTPATYKICFVFRMESNFAVGQLLLEPGGVKGACCCNNELFFTVTMGKVEVKINESTNRLSHGGRFRVPEGNLYSIRNLSTRHAASLDFTKVNLDLVKTKDTSNDQQDETLRSRSQSIDDGVGC